MAVAGEDASSESFKMMMTSEGSGELALVLMCGFRRLEGTPRCCKRSL